MEQAPVIKSKKGDVLLPCMSPIIVPIDKVQANDYNPNHVTSRNMRLLEKSIISNGFCYPVVTIFDAVCDKYIVVDGFHRYLIFRDYLQAESIPVIVLSQSISQRMEATVQFNRARGVHQIEEMGDLVAALIKQGVSEDKIAKDLGMELDEVLRLKQITGIAEIFLNQNYSRSWTMVDTDE